MGGTAGFDRAVSVYGIPLHPGLVSGGKRFFVDPTNNDSSDGNEGTDIARPLKSLTRAHALCTAGNNDVVYYIGGTTAATSLTTTLTWSKNYTHLIGVAAPVGVASRARQFMSTAATTVSPMVTVSATGCIFENVYFFHGLADATALINLNLTGGRNYFRNCHFAGIGDATQSAAGACDIKLDGAEECVFDQCFIGLDTIGRDADAVNLLFDGAAHRIMFRDCLIYAYITATGYTHLKVNDATGIDRWIMFDRCLFLSDSENRGIAQTAIMNLPVSSQGKIILKDTYYSTDDGATVWVAAGRSTIRNNSVASAVSGAGGEMTIL